MDNITKTTETLLNKLITSRACLSNDSTLVENIIEIYTTISKLTEPQLIKSILNESDHIMKTSAIYMDDIINKVKDDESTRTFIHRVLKDVPPEQMSSEITIINMSSFTEEDEILIKKHVEKIVGHGNVYHCLVLDTYEDSVHCMLKETTPGYTNTFNLIRQELKDGDVSHCFDELVGHQSTSTRLIDIPLNSIKPSGFEKYTVCDITAMSIADMKRINNFTVEIMKNIESCTELLASASERYMEVYKKLDVNIDLSDSVYKKQKTLFLKKLADRVNRIIKVIKTFSTVIAHMYNDISVNGVNAYIDESLTFLERYANMRPITNADDREAIYNSFKTSKSHMDDMSVDESIDMVTPLLQYTSEVYNSPNITLSALQQHLVNAMNDRKKNGDMFTKIPLDKMSFYDISRNNQKAVLLVDNTNTWSDLNLVMGALFGRSVEWNGSKYAVVISPRVSLDTMSNDANALQQTLSHEVEHHIRGSVKCDVCKFKNIDDFGDLYINEEFTINDKVAPLLNRGYRKQGLVPGSNDISLTNAGINACIMSKEHVSCVIALLRKEKDLDKVKEILKQLLAI